MENTTSIYLQASDFTGSVSGAQHPEGITPMEISIANDPVSNEAAIAGLLLNALASSSALTASVSDELRTAIECLAQGGSAAIAPIAQELRQHLVAVKVALSGDGWNELCTRCSQSTTAEWQALSHEACQMDTGTSATTHAPQHLASEIYASPAGLAIQTLGLTGLKGVLHDTRDDVEAALRVVRGMGSTAFDALVAALPPLLRFEIARDFFQTVGIFFEGLYAPVIAFLKDQGVFSGIRDIVSTLRGAYDAMALNIMAAIKEASQKRTAVGDTVVAVLLVGIGIVYISYLWFVFKARHLHNRTNEVRHGHEATNWATIASKRRMHVRIFTFVITTCLTAYLPLTRICLDVVLAATTSNFDGTDEEVTPSKLVMIRFKSSSAWSFVIVAASVLLATFTLPLPWFLLRAIQKNRPAGSLENPMITHDLDGEQVPFDNKIYAQLVERDPSQQSCPYRSLYDGFERNWSHYKVLQLLSKLALVLVLLLVLATGHDERLIGVLSCVINAGVVILTSLSRPFSDPLNNVMDISGKVAALTTCVGGTILAYVGKGDSKSRSLEAIMSVVAAVNVVNIIVMTTIELLGMNGTRLFLKNRLGWLTFSDMTRGINDAPAKDIVPNWDVEKEVKRRVWQAFWRAALLDVVQPAKKGSNDGSQGNNTGGQSHEDRNSSGVHRGKEKSGMNVSTVVHRLEELEQAVIASGIHRVRSHWLGEQDAYTIQLRHRARSELEGVDVYWDDPTGTRDGHLDSASRFGKMYVVPYPFHYVVVYDDAKDETIVRDEISESTAFSNNGLNCNLAKLLSLNFSPSIVAKRELRQKLRALSARATKIHFPFSREELVTVEDGTETTQNSDGSRTTRTQHTTVSFICHYTQGVLHVATKGSSNGRVMAEGFDVTMTYNDGYGDARAPHTGQVHHVRDRHAVMGHDHIGLTAAMNESRQLRHIFEQTGAEWSAGLNQVRAEIQEYRRMLQVKHMQANTQLSDSFWYFVYNNPRISRVELEQYLRQHELNQALQDLPDVQAPALEALYLQLDFVYSHRAIAFWYVFWDDIYERNGAMNCFRNLASDLDPREPTAICYHVKTREELETWLRERELLGKWRLFRPQLLDLLYNEMEKCSSTSLWPRVQQRGAIA